jgi:phosphoacetylglucosamine mutase
MSTEGIKAVQTLKELSNLINQTVGDALSDLLLVQCILTITSKSFNEWDKEYTDLPSRQEKVKVSDRNLFVPINADQQLSEPKDLQTKIDSIVALYQSGRCFVRPSGTEDVVRVYAEALTREETDELAFKVCGLVFDHYGGVGVRPGTYL